MGTILNHPNHRSPYKTGSTVHVHVCRHACMCVHACTHARVSWCLCICGMCVCMRVHVCIFVHTHIHVCVFIVYFCTSVNHERKAIII